MEKSGFFSALRSVLIANSISTGSFIAFAPSFRTSSIIGASGSISYFKSPLKVSILIPFALGDSDISPVYGSKVEAMPFKLIGNFSVHSNGSDTRLSELDLGSKGFVISRA